MITPRTPAPKAGTVLVDRYGAPTGTFVIGEEGTPLPPVGVNGYCGPLSWCLVGYDEAEAA